MQSTQTLQPLYSVYGDDPSLGELVRIFVKGLPQRVETLQSHADEEDWESMARVARQLNSLASTYGFAQLSALAARLEVTCREQYPASEVLRAFENFARLSKRIRAGSPHRYALN